MCERFAVFALACLFIGTGSFTAAAKGQSGDTLERPAISVTLLGTGTPVPSATQAGAAILVEAGDETLLFDCGRGCTTRLAQLNPALIAKIDRLFVTHLHSDHVVGIDDLWLNGWLQGRDEPLSIWGPKGLKKMMRYLRKAYSADIRQRINDGVPATVGGIAESFTELKTTGVIYEENGVTVTAVSVEHVPGEPCFGYKVEVDGRSVFVSGDTTLTDALFLFGKDVDVLIQEVVSPALVGYLQNTFDKNQVDSIVSIHTTAAQAGALFGQTKPRLAVFYHTKSEGAFSASLLEETSAFYAGAVVVGHDLMRIDVGDKITVSPIEER
ncbi:MAG: MBL fold metallo-hydrolase [Amphiplicatus sp.]